MLVRRSLLGRGAAFAALVLAAASCDALIGLGEEPTGGAPSSSSTGDATSSSTGDATSSSTGDATSSSGGGAGTASAATGTGGAGGDGAGGGGGAGGALPGGPCGPCDGDESCARCDPENTRCVERYSEPVSVWSEGNETDAHVNRLGRGLAVTGAIVAFWGQVGAGESAVFMFDRATGDWLPTLPLGSSAATFFAIGAMPGGDVYLADNQQELRKLVQGDGGWSVQSVPGYTLPSVGALGGAENGLLLIDTGGGAWMLDPTAPSGASNPCRLSNDLSLGGAPIDARVEIVGQERRALAMGYDGVPSFARGTFACPSADFEVTPVQNLVRGLAVTTFGGNYYVKAVTSTEDSGDPRVLMVSADGKVGGAGRLETNRSRALDVRATGALVPGRNGGLGRCALNLAEGSCGPVLDASRVGDVKELVTRPGLILALGFQGQGLGPGEAVLACVDEAP